MNGHETEVKFYVRDLKMMESRLLELKARLIQPRIHEINFRYDLPDGSLRANGCVLRLRHDTNAILTYKGPSSLIDGVFSRTELETTIGDLETAQGILKALGYVQILIYEKYRAIYEINEYRIMLDELPYGSFVEIEGSDAANIRKMALHMGLDFESAVGAGYARIFENYKLKYGFPSNDLTFDAFHGKKPSPEELNMRAADE
ncbi:MAG: class IV adenylate cyclase [Anaerolineaceae bacterium]|nr:MAG: class IV adenylate cyclase [Anaerolineaceae bacterium]